MAVLKTVLGNGLMASKASQSVLPGLLALALLLAPAAALAAPPAQEGILDPGVIEAIQSASVIVAASMGAGGAPAEQAVDVPTEEPTPEPAGEPTAEPTGEVIIPNPDDFVEFEAEGINMLVPDNWEVVAGDGALINFSDEPTGIDGQLQDFGAEFPGTIIFPIFESQAEAFVQSIGDEAELTGVSRLAVEQGLPVLRIGFANADNDGSLMDGAIYLVATGDNAYGFFLGANPEYWPDLAPVADAMAESILFDDALVTLEQAGDEGMTFDDPDGAYSLEVPAGWYVSPVNDPELRVVVNDPDVTAVGAVAVKAGVESDDAQLKALTEAIAGTLPEEEAQALIEGVLQEIELTADGGVAIDTTRTQVFPTEGDSIGIIRIGGTADIEEGLSLPITMYLAVYSDRVAALVVFGEPNALAAQEETLVGILDSLSFTE